MSRIKRPPRAPYAQQACGWCRHKRIRCSGEPPVCRTCETAGRGSECSWGPEPIRRPNSKDYVRSLNQYIAVLETRLEQCRKEHGGIDTEYLQLRPNPPMEEEPLVMSEEEENEEQMQTFRREGHVITFYGGTSVHQYAPRVPRHLSRFPEVAEDSSQSHVLMVEGVDRANFNPNFDWSRHLPQEVHLDRMEHDTLLDLLFKFVTSWCLRIVPELFLRDMCRVLSAPPSQTPMKTRHYSPMLHNALVALATAFSDDPRIQDLKFRHYFANKAKTYIDDECREPDISVMHALSILGSFHSSLGDQTLGYMYFGMSGRVSQCLGLSIDCSRWVRAGVITHNEMLDRNWAHWNIFAMDVCWSLYMGRGFSVAAPPPHRSIPIPFVDSEYDKMPWNYPPSGLPPQPNHLSSTFAATCKLLQIGRRIMDIVHTLSNPASRHTITNEMVYKLDVELNAWKDELSAEVDIKLSGPVTATPHRLMVHLAFYWLFILLHRPFYRRARPIPGNHKDIDHVKICDKAARNIMELLLAWRKLYELRYVPVTMSGIIFSAGTVFLLSALQTAPGGRTARAFSQSLAQADLCIEYLLESGKSFQCANAIAEILRNFLQQELTARSRSRERPIASSPTEMHREVAEMPDSPLSPVVAPTTQDIFDHLNPVSASQLPNQPHYGWHPGMGMGLDLQEPAGLSEDRTYWEYLTAGMADDAMNHDQIAGAGAGLGNDAGPSVVNGGATSAFQENYEFGGDFFGGGMELSVYLEDRMGRQLVFSDSDFVANDVGALLRVETFAADNTQYPME